jgi:hypothetical protein
MSNDTQTRYARSLPTLSTALADITLTAYQRTFALNAAVLEHLLSNGINQSQQALQESTSGQPMTGWSNPLLRSASFEQLWRYSAGMMAISQAATASLANLVTAQMRGADKEVETISKDAHQEVAEAAASAAAAAGSVMSNGLAAVSRMTEMATSAGNALGAQAQQQAEQVARGAFNGGGQRGRGGARTARHH